MDLGLKFVSVFSALHKLKSMLITLFDMNCKIWLMTTIAFLQINTPSGMAKNKCLFRLAISMHFARKADWDRYGIKTCLLGKNAIPI